MTFDDILEQVVALLKWQGHKGKERSQKRQEAQ